MELRDYQKQLETEIYAAWDKNYTNVGVQLATGGGKTALFTKIVKDFSEPATIIAHRMQIVSQISLTLARCGVYHNIIGSRTMIKSIISLHIADTKQSFYQPRSNKIVACVDTLVKIATESWMKRTRLVVQDEAHHVLRDNKWGKAAAMFENALGLYPTATPVRADGYGLGSCADGILDCLLVGPTMRELIERGYLTDYRIFAPPSDVDLSNVTISAGGDYSPEKLRMAMHKSHITGDLVQHYLRIAKGKLGVTFVVDIESANQTAAAYRAAGVPAEVITSKTPDLLRFSLMQRFKNREILQLVNVDLLGEGVDVPAIEVVSMGRPTESYALYAQQFGRALRPMENKSHAIIIDHVGNTLRHGLPDGARDWSLDRRERRSRGIKSDVTPIRTCLNDLCLSVYERYLKKCPYCGAAPKITDRSQPEYVDGDLLELSPEALAKLRGEVARIDGPPRVPQNLDNVAQMGVMKNHKLRQQSQQELRKSIAFWAGIQKQKGHPDDEIYKLFFIRFGTDILTAQTLNSREATELKNNIDNVVNKSYPNFIPSENYKDE